MSTGSSPVTLRPTTEAVPPAGLEARAGSEQTTRVLLVCSPGGHLQQMLTLAPAYESFNCTWVTLEAADVGYLLDGRDVKIGFGPTNRSIKALLRNLAFAWRTVRDTNADTIVSTGAGLAVPFMVVGYLLRKRLVYVESVTRVDSLSLTGRLVSPFVDAFLVQWPEVAEESHALYRGGIL